MNKLVTKLPQESWEIDFYKQIKKLEQWWYTLTLKNINKRKDQEVAMKDFIQHLLTSDRQRVVEIIKKMKIGEAEGWDYFFSKRGRCCPGDDFSDVYNKALEDIIKSLNKL